MFDDVLKPAGIIRVGNYEEMFDILKLLSLQPLPPGGRVGMVTSGAGSTVLAVDRMDTSRYLSLPSLAPETEVGLRETLPPYCVFVNPVDITGSLGSGRWSHRFDTTGMVEGSHLVTVVAIDAVGNRVTYDAYFELSPGEGGDGGEYVPDDEEGGGIDTGGSIDTSGSIDSGLIGALFLFIIIIAVIGFALSGRSEKSRY